MPGDGDQHAKPGYVQHGLTIDRVYLFSQLARVG
jgi:hypothetical protein